jgi:hypothetical protein
VEFWYGNVPLRQACCCWAQVIHIQGNQSSKPNSPCFSNLLLSSSTLFLRWTCDEHSHRPGPEAAQSALGCRELSARSTKTAHSESFCSARATASYLLSRAAVQSIRRESGIEEMGEKMEGGQASSSSESPLKVNLQIVSPSFGVGTLAFPDIPAATTIQQLKEKIRDAIPVRPSNELQRLIHRGRMLARENDTLQDVFGVEAVRQFIP